MFLQEEKVQRETELRNAIFNSYIYQNGLEDTNKKERRKRMKSEDLSKNKHD